MSGRARQQAGKRTEQVVADFYARQGCRVYRIGRPGVAAGARGFRGTMMSPGVPDFWVMLPDQGRGWWHEAKGPRATTSPAQARFKAEAERCGLTVIVGDWRAAARHLETLGVLRLIWLDKRLVRIERRAARRQAEGGKA